MEIKIKNNSVSEGIVTKFIKNGISAPVCAGQTTLRP
jgi:hypothetical protein